MTDAPHSLRPSTKSQHKPFKSRKATKGSLRDASKGRVSQDRSSRKTPHQQIMSKLDRKNQARQRQAEKHKDHQKDTSVFTGRDGAPRNVAVVPLCSDCDAEDAVQALNRSLDIETPAASGPFRVSVERFKQKIQYMALKRDLTACLDAARGADFVVLVLSAEVEVDELGELILRCIEGQGLSTAFVVVQGLDKIEPAKQRASVVASLKSFIAHFLPDQEKLFNLDSRQECANLMRSLCSTTPRGVRWRDERSWMLVEDVYFSGAETGAAILTGVVRGTNLNPDRLVYVGDWGTFQVEKITAAPLASHRQKMNARSTADAVDHEDVLALPSEDRDELDDLAPEEVIMEDVENGPDEDAQSVAPTAPKKGVLLDDHHYFSEEDETENQVPLERLPPGTSRYQAAWYLNDNLSDSASDLEDENHNGGVQGEADSDWEDEDDEMPSYRGIDEQTEAGPSQYAQSEVMEELDEEDDAKQLAAFRAKKRDEAQEDMEFPDEIELHPDVLARERLARYRGLKSLRTSAWEEEEDRVHEPAEWRRLLRVHDHQSSRIKAVREAMVGGVARGTRVHVHLRDVPQTAQETYDKSQPIVMFGLLRHEQKRTALNALLNLSSDWPKSIKSKEELVVQCGPRRFVIQPIFSQSGTTPNDVHKYCRYVHPGQSALASFLGPVTWGAVPILYFKRNSGGEAGMDGDATQSALPLSLAATGTALPPSTSRVVAKRVILTGHPYHIHKKIVTIRYMFFNKDDVEWFKALPLWTRRGRSGYIKEALGTHGYFKATFDGRINPQDSIAMSLYKRVWPRNSAPFTGLLSGDFENVKDGDADMAEAAAL